MSLMVCSSELELDDVLHQGWESTRAMLAEGFWPTAHGFPVPPMLPEMLASPTGGSCVYLREEFRGVCPERQH